MTILVWGMGHCGLVNSACLAAQGHDVVGLDKDPERIASLQGGSIAIHEPGLLDLVTAAVAAGRLTFAMPSSEQVVAADTSVICVDTPTCPLRGLNTDAVVRIIDSIVQAGSKRPGRHVIIVRSTAVIGFLRSDALAALIQSGRDDARDAFGLVTVPEFLREGQAIEDFFAPTFTVIGPLDPESEQRAIRYFERPSSPTFVVSPETAEMLKLVNNAFHALKVSFANEVGRIGGALGADAVKVMEIICSDTKLNLAPAYFRPGFPFGGSCLPKDLPALSRAAAGRDVSAPLLDAILVSNGDHLEAVRSVVRREGVNRVGLVGLAFKAGTDDVRASPALDLLAKLIEDGQHVLAFDPHIVPGEVSPRNRRLLAERLGPTFDDVLAESLDTLVAVSDLVVVAHADPDLLSQVRRRVNGKVAIVDLSDPRMFSLTR